MNTVDKILTLFHERGDEAYLGEPVSQTEHALQTAHWASLAKAPDHLLVAALLHDIGHLLSEGSGHAADRGIDACHEQVGYAYLDRLFGPPVAEPVQLHVAAKRYLCATNPAYLERLSPASLKSLALQGGAFSPSEAAAFAENQYHRAALDLRVWDDLAKLPGLPVAPLADYQPIIYRCLIHGR